MGDETRCRSLEEVNALSREEFLDVFSGVVEDTEEAADRAEQCRPFNSVEALVHCFHQYLQTLSPQGKREVLEKHPELGAKVTMSLHSQHEQAASGVASLPPRQNQRLLDLNLRYRQKFGFPFVICVKENTTDSVVRGLETRLDNSPEQEIQEATEQVKRIAALRIRRLVAKDL